MDPTTIPKMQSAEKNYDGRPTNEPGIYVHKESGAKFITAPGNEGIAQADYLMTERWKGGWERVDDVPTRVELEKMRKAQLLKDTASDAVQKKADEAEMKAIEDEATKLAEKMIADKQAEEAPAETETKTEDKTEVKDEVEVKTTKSVK